MFQICVLVHIYLSCFVFFILYLCVFVLGCGSSAPNEDIVRFRCWGRGESYILFAHIFVKFFQFLYSFLGIGVVCAFFYWYLISNCLIASLHIRRICMIAHLSIV